MSVKKYTNEQRYGDERWSMSRPTSFLTGKVYVGTSFEKMSAGQGPLRLSLFDFSDLFETLALVLKVCVFFCLLYQFGVFQCHFQPFNQTKT